MYSVDHFRVECARRGFRRPLGTRLMVFAVELLQLALYLFPL